MPNGYHKAWTERTRAVSFVKCLGRVYQRYRSALGPQIKFYCQATASHVEMGTRATRFVTLASGAEKLELSLGALFVEASIFGRTVKESDRAPAADLCKTLNECRQPWNQSEFQISLGDVLREVRGGHQDVPRMNLRQLGTEIEVDHSYLSRVERGHSDISIAILFDACEALGTNIARVVVNAIMLDCVQSDSVSRIRALLSQATYI